MRGLTRIERAQTERALSRSRSQRPQRDWKPCVYCGQYVLNYRYAYGPAVCSVHSDLPSLDPHYQA